MRFVQICHEVCGHPTSNTTPWHLVVTVICHLCHFIICICDDQQTYTTLQDIRRGPVPSVTLPLTDASNGVEKCQRRESFLIPLKATRLEVSSTAESQESLLFQALPSLEHRTAKIPGLVWN